MEVNDAKLDIENKLPNTWKLLELGRGFQNGRPGGRCGGELGGLWRQTWLRIPVPTVSSCWALELVA